MAGKSAILTIKILSDASKASQGLDDATGKAGKFERGLSTGAKVGGAALVGLGAAATKATLAAEEVASANARVGQTLKNAGMGQATDRVIAYADSLESSLGIDEKVIKNTQAKLATFHNLAGSAGEAGGAFDRATLAAQDMAAAGMGDAESNAIQLGKALNDPIKGISALNRVGVQFTDSQKKQIEAMQKSGDMAGAQDLILKELESQVGGTAAATADSSAKMALGFQEVGETIGAALLPILNQMAPVIQNVAKWMQQNATVAVVVGAAIAGLSVAVIALNAGLKAYRATAAAVAAVQKAMQAAALGTRIQLALLAVQQKVTAAATKVAAVAQRIFNAAMRANPIGLIITVIMALIGVFVLLWNKNAAFRNFFIASWKAIKVAAAAVWKGIKTAVSVVIKAITIYIKVYVAVVKAVWRAIKAAASATWKGIKTVIKAVVDWMKGAIRTARDVVKGVWTAIKTAAKSAWDGVKNAIKTVVEWMKGALRGARDVIKGVWTAIKTAATTAWDGVKGAVLKVRDWMKSAFDGVKTAISKVWSGIKSAFDTAFDPIEGVIDGIKSAFDNVVDAAKSVVDWFGRIKMPSISWPKPPAWVDKLFSAPLPPEPAPALARTAGGPVLYGAGVGGPPSGPIATALTGGTVQININGGLSSSSDIARAVRRVVRTDNRRRGGIVIDRRRQQVGI